jgi:geranylgeranyl pyrophosphate synthase
MPTEEKLMDQVTNLLINRSKKAIELARQAIRQEQIKDELLREALRYFMEEIWCSASHPALLSLACEAVGGTQEATANIGAAFVVLTGAADIHDDIIDQSQIKDSKLTVFGKYGKDMALIAGDILWFKGLLMLNEACASFVAEKKKAILKLTKEAFFDIASAESKETRLRANFDLSPQEYLDLIGIKVSVAEASAKIGAIIGNGTDEQVESLGTFGKTLGLLMTKRDEFVDMFELDELKNRFKNECLPLPMLCAFQDKTLKKEIFGILEKEELTQADLDRVLEIIINDPEVRKLVSNMSLSVEEASKCLICLKKNRDIFSMLLNSALINLVG